MQYLASILQPTPLTIHFSLQNDAPEPAWIPRVLRPLGIMVQVEVRSDRGKVVYENPAVRATWKLQPDSDDSYQQLEPGYTFGVVLPVDDFEPENGRYEVRLSYTNAPYRGTPARNVRDMRFSTTLQLVVG
jgi:hypothetical protein